MRLAFSTLLSHCCVTLLLAPSLHASGAPAMHLTDTPTKRSSHALSGQTSTLVRKQLARLPLAFYPVSTDAGAAVYESHTPGYDLAVHATGMTIRSQRTVIRSAEAQASGGGLAIGHSPEQVVRHIASLEFLGASHSAAPEGLDRENARVNRFSGQDPSQWQRNLPTFGRVRAQGVYPGIDVIYYGGMQGALEYDLVLAPHADLKQIKFRVQGDQPAVLEKDGSLDLDGKDGSVRLKRPVLYQDEKGGRKAIQGRFVQLAKGEFGFQSVAYDHARPLIVDPQIQLVYATYAGGIHNDEEFDMAVDASGSAYIVGGSASEDFPVTGNALQTTRKEIGVYSYDAVILKFDASGNLIYSTFLGGTGNDTAYAVVANPDGSVYVGGGTQSSDFPVTSGAFQMIYGGGSDAFLAKISNDGSQLLYSTYLGGSADESIQSMILNSDGTLWIGGDASGAGLPVSATAAQKTAPGADDDFVAKAQFSQAGVLSLPYLTYLGGSGNGQELGHIDMAVDSTGNVYVAGGTTSGDYPVTTNAYEKPFTTSGGCYNTQLPNTVGSLTKFSPDLSQILYSTVLGGHVENQNGYPVCNQFIRTVHVDASGNIWMIGTTGMADFPTTSNAMSKQLNGNNTAGVDDFITELSADGSKLLYSTYFGGSQFDYGARASWDSSGHLWLVTTTQSPDYPVTSGAVQSTNAGGYDTGVTELSADGTAILYSTYLGGSGDDDINGSPQIKLDTQGNVHLAGMTSSTNYPITASAVQPLFANGDQGPDGTDLYYSILGSGLIGTVGPVVGGNTGDTTLTLSGAGFQSGASCQLNLNGTLLTATKVSVSPTGTSISCTFALNGATAGIYDVIVTNPNGGGSFTKAASFTVQSGGAPNVWVNIVTRPKIRTGTPSTVVVTYGNSGTVDAYMSHLIVTLPSNIQASYTVGIPPNAPSGTQLPTSSQAGGLNSIRLLLPRIPAGSSHSFQMAITDSTNNDQYTLTAAISKPWFTSESAAESALSAATTTYTPATTCASQTAPTNCLNQYLTTLHTNGATTTQVQSIAQGMLSSLQQIVKYGSSPTIQGSTSYVPASTLVTGTLVVSGIVSFDDTINYNVAGTGQKYTVPTAQANCVSYANNPNDAIGGTLERCTLPITVPTGSGITVAGGSYGSGGSLIPTFDTCFTVKQDISAAGFTMAVTAGTQFCSLNADTGDDDDDDDTIIDDGGYEFTGGNDGFLEPDGGSGATSGGASGGSIDPNGKNGPVGDGSSSHYIPATGALTYNLYFENEASASLPAAQVVVTDQLDSTKVDLSTVTFGPAGFGTNALMPPAGSVGFSKTYTPPGVTNYVVRVQASADQNTGLLKWTFTTIDPTTGQPPSDPTIGFLPPDTDGVIGQGSVVFSVMPKAAQTTGTQVTNGASVVFDTNAAILTPVFLNTLDADAPVSSVTALPAVETVATGVTSSTFAVSWSGTDKGAGIKSYTVFVSDNGGSFTPWQVGVKTTTASYTGTAGHTYGFYTIATDGAGNVESAKTKADTTTTVTSLIGTTTTLNVPVTTAAVGTSLSITATVTPSTGSGTPTNMVTFMDGTSTVLAMMSLSGGKATLTTSSLALGGHTITAVYSGDSNYAGSTSTGTTITITAAPSFSVALSSGSGTITGAGTSSSTVSLTPAGGFSAAITLSCSGLPTYTTCTFNPTSLTPTGTAAATSTMTITTNVATAFLQRPGNSGIALAGLSVAGLLGLLLRRRRLPLLAGLLSLVVFGVYLSGCSDSSPASSPTTPKGTYTVTVTATSGSITHTVPYTLTVQ